MKFRSTKYPSLILSGLGARFVNGELDSDDPKVIARAKQLGRLGVEAASDQAPPREGNDGTYEVPAVDPDATHHDDGDADVTPVVTTVEPTTPPTIEPPKGNASRGAWAAYAESQGYEVPEDASRDDIRDLVADA